MQKELDIPQCVFCDYTVARSILSVLRYYLGKNGTISLREIAQYLNERKNFILDFDDFNPKEYSKFYGYIDLSKASIILVESEKPEYCWSLYLPDVLELPRKNDGQVRSRPNKL